MIQRGVELITIIRHRYLIFSFMLGPQGATHITNARDYYDVYNV